MAQKCTDCHGTGRCRYCGGTGQYAGTKCGWCATSSRDGHSLPGGGVNKGTGLCKKCYGTGEIG